MYLFSADTQLFLEQKAKEKDFEPISQLLETLKDGYNHLEFSRLSMARNIEKQKFIALNVLMQLARQHLEDHELTEIETQDYTFLKKTFKIQAGDFLHYKRFEVYEILKMEFKNIYADDRVDENEKMLQVKLQSLFDLSYDAFEQLKKEEVIASLKKGIDPKHLDISKLPK